MLDIDNPEWCNQNLEGSPLESSEDQKNIDLQTDITIYTWFQNGMRMQLWFGLKLTCITQEQSTCLQFLHALGLEGSCLKGNDSINWQMKFRGIPSFRQSRESYWLLLARFELRGNTLAKWYENLLVWPRRKMRVQSWEQLMCGFKETGTVKKNSSTSY